MRLPGVPVQVVPPAIVTCRFEICFASMFPYVPTAIFFMRLVLSLARPGRQRGRLFWGRRAVLAFEYNFQNSLRPSKSQGRSNVLSGPRLRLAALGCSSDHRRFRNRFVFTPMLPAQKTKAPNAVRISGLNVRIVVLIAHINPVRSCPHCHVN
jgi:hypothetical protein